MTIAVRVTDTPSKSKGWGRYALADAEGRPVVQSRTGNEWVSANHEGEAAQGAALVLTMQVMLREGRSSRETVYTETVQLVAEEGATAQVRYRPGSQGIALTITGARRADA